MSQKLAPGLFVLPDIDKYRLRRDPIRPIKVYSYGFDQIKEQILSTEQCSEFASSEVLAGTPTKKYRGVSAGL